MKSVELWDVKFDKRSHSVPCLAIYIKAWPQLELILCHSVQGWIFLAWGIKNKEQSPLQKKCFQVQVWVAENGLPKCEADSPRFEQAAVFRHVKGLKSTSEILGAQHWKCWCAWSQCCSALDSCERALWKSFMKVCFPPLPPFAMATGWGVNKYPLGAWCRQQPDKERCSEYRHSWKKRRF